MSKMASQSNWLDAAAATWPECRDFLARTPCEILPLGATEQHGPHLPQNTDTVIAEAPGDGGRPGECRAGAAARADRLFLGLA